MGGRTPAPSPGQEGRPRAAVRPPPARGGLSEGLGGKLHFFSQPLPQPVPHAGVLSQRLSRHRAGDFTAGLWFPACSSGMPSLWGLGRDLQGPARCAGGRLRPGGPEWHRGPRPAPAARSRAVTSGGGPGPASAAQPLAGVGGPATGRAREGMNGAGAGGEQPSEREARRGGRVSGR